METDQPSETASTVSAIVGGDADESMDMVRRVETDQPSETASTVSAIVGGDADESMDMVRLEEEAFHGIEGAKAARSSPS